MTDPDGPAIPQGSHCLPGHYAIDWLCEAYDAELEAGHCCETLAKDAADLLTRHQHRPAPRAGAVPAVTGRVSAEQVATVVHELARLGGIDPVSLLREALEAYTGIGAEQREVF